MGIDIYRKNKKELESNSNNKKYHVEDVYRLLQK